MRMIIPVSCRAAIGQRMEFIFFLLLGPVIGELFGKDGKPV